MIHRLLNANALWFQVQWEHSLDSLLDDFKRLRIHKLRAHALGA